MGVFVTTMIYVGLQPNRARIMITAWHLYAGYVFPRSASHVIHYKTEENGGINQSFNTR